jgi:1-phosphofructokinase family hexose kinase
MFLTITANAALDRVIFIPEFTPTTNMRAERVHDCVGGKGFDTSVVLQALGVEQLALGFLAGPTGRTLEQVLLNYGIPLEITWVDGDTRIAHVISETRLHRHSHVITPGYRISEAQADEFVAGYTRRLAQAEWVIASGSLAPGLPAGFYQQLTRLAHDHGARMLIDCPGDPARLAVPEKPDILKMNLDELHSTFSLQAGEVRTLEPLVRRLREQAGLPAVVITAGPEGVLAVTPEGSYLSAAPRQNAVNAAGAGDAVSASLTWRLARGETWAQAMHWAAAVSAASVLTEGTSDCHMQDVERIYPQVSVTRL